MHTRQFVQRGFLNTLGAIIVLMSTSFGLVAQPLSSDELTALLDHPARPAQDRQRDKLRHPAKIMQFAEVAKGAVILDLFAGDGWYSELFSYGVGPEGKVYAHNDSLTWRFAQKGMEKRTQDNRLTNVTRLDQQDLDKLAVPANSVDIVFTALNYHDLFFTQMMQNGKLVEMRSAPVDYLTALAGIHAALKDDGILVIIDHVAKAGSGYKAANNLHRIDPAIVKFQLNEAGFELVEEAYYLRNPDDRLDTLVFDEKVRGQTDRFIYKFKKK